MKLCFLGRLNLVLDGLRFKMKDELEDLAGHRLNALISIEANKARADGMTRKLMPNLLTRETWCGN